MENKARGTIPLKAIGSLLLVLVIVLFSVLNVKKVPLSFGFFEFTAPLILVIVASAILGALIIFLTSGTVLLQQRKKIRQLEKEQVSWQQDFDQRFAEEKAKLQRECENQLAAAEADFQTQLAAKQLEVAKAEEESAE